MTRYFDFCFCSSQKAKAAAAAQATGKAAAAADAAKALINLGQPVAAAAVAAAKARAPRLEPAQAAEDHKQGVSDNHHLVEESSGDSDDMDVGSSGDEEDNGIESDEESPPIKVCGFSVSLFFMCPALVVADTLLLLCL